VPQLSELVFWGGPVATWINSTQGNQLNKIKSNSNGC